MSFFTNVTFLFSIRRFIRTRSGFSVSIVVIFVSRCRVGFMWGGGRRRNTEEGRVVAGFFVVLKILGRSYVLIKEIVRKS